jgi:hypothetical protein
MTHDELVEKVARAIAGDDDDWWEDYSLYAKRAIAVVLEEAAKVADDYHRVVEQKRDLFEDGNITITKGYTLVDPRKIAAAIRKLKGDA